MRDGPTYDTSEKRRLRNRLCNRRYFPHLLFCRKFTSLHGKDKPQAADSPEKPAGGRNHGDGGVEEKLPDGDMESGDACNIKVEEEGKGESEEEEEGQGETVSPKGDMNEGEKQEGVGASKEKTFGGLPLDACQWLFMGEGQKKEWAKILPPPPRVTIRESPKSLHSQVTNLHPSLQTASGMSGSMGQSANQLGSRFWPHGQAEILGRSGWEVERAVPEAEGAPVLMD